MGLSTQATPPEDVNMPLSQPRVNPISLYTSRTPAQTHPPTVVAPQLLAESIFRESSSAQLDSASAVSNRPVAHPPQQSAGIAGGTISGRLENDSAVTGSGGQATKPRDLRTPESMDEAVMRTMIATKIPASLNCVPTQGNSLPRQKAGRQVLAHSIAMRSTSASGSVVDPPAQSTKMPSVSQERQSTLLPHLQGMLDHQPAHHGANGVPKTIQPSRISGGPGQLPYQHAEIIYSAVPPSARHSPLRSPTPNESQRSARNWDPGQHLTSIPADQAIWKASDTHIHPAAGQNPSLPSQQEQRSMSYSKAAASITPEPMMMSPFPTPALPQANDHAAVISQKAIPRSPGNSAVHVAPAAGMGVAPLAQQQFMTQAAMIDKNRLGIVHGLRSGSVPGPGSASVDMNLPLPVFNPSRPTAARGPSVYAATCASPMHNRFVGSKGDVAVLARASESIPNMPACQPPVSGSYNAHPVAAKTVRPALSFGGSRKRSSTAVKAGNHCLFGEALQNVASPVDNEPGKRIRPSVLTRKLLTPAEQRPADEATTTEAHSDGPSSSRTESVPPEGDTALSLSSDSDSEHTQRAHSSVDISQITIKHLVDSGLLSVGPQVLRIPLKEGTQLAGVQCDGTLVCDGRAVSTVSGLVRDTCGACSEGRAWRTVHYGGNRLQHYQRLFCLRMGALCPPEVLVDSPRRGGDHHPFALHAFEPALQSEASLTYEWENSVSVQRGAGHVPAASSIIDIKESAQTISGVKRTRRQEAVAQATEAEELSDSLLRPSDPLSSLPMNCLLERGIARYGSLPAVASVPTPLAKHVTGRPAIATINGGSTSIGTKTVKIVLKSGIKTQGQPVTKAPPTVLTANAVDDAIPKEPASVVTPASEPVLQALDKMQRLPPMPRKVKTLAATMPRAPIAAPSSTAICPVDSQQRSRRDVRAPPRHNGISGLDHTMMQLESYSKPPGEKGIDVQPFAVDVHPLAVAAMDIHAHMCQNEIIGVLGGTYDASAGRLRILRAVSVKEGPLDVGHTDVEMDAADQSRAIEELRQEGLQCVGWYHSHPTFAVWPSAIDVYNQVTQQVAHSQELVASGTPAPYIAAIVGPYDQKNATAQSSMSWFYVENKRSAEFSIGMEPEQCLQHMVPKLLVTNLLADVQLQARDLADCATSLIQKYSIYQSRIEFREFWRPEMTNLQKLISSLFHSVRAYLEPEDLKEVGNKIISEVMKNFYGMQPAIKATASRHASSTKASRLAKRS